MLLSLSPDGVDGDQVGQLAIITRSNFTLFKEAVKICVYSDIDAKVAFAGVRIAVFSIVLCNFYLQYFDTVGWVAGSVSGS